MLKKPCPGALYIADEHRRGSRYVNQFGTFSEKEK